MWFSDILLVWKPFDRAKFEQHTYDPEVGCMVCWKSRGNVILECNMVMKISIIF
jgi:hypothetical protein